MGAVKICAAQNVKKPYQVQNTGVRLYSMEELAYYLYENIYLIDEYVIGENLYDWIERELGLTSLADRLRCGVGTGNHIYNQVMTILQVSEYYSKEELTVLSKKITSISELQTQERMKFRADEFLQNDNYWEAIAEYEKILSIRQSTKLDVSFYAKVWNNLAVCYTRLFLFQKASCCFENAYQFQKIPEYSAKAYYARRLGSIGKKEEEQLMETKVSEEFIKGTNAVFAELQEQSKILCREEELEKELKACEAKYLKNVYL